MNDPQQHHRRSIRLKGFDYSQDGAYFVTLVAQGRACLFGEISDDKMGLNDAGKMIEAVWMGLTARFPGVELGEFVVMPNHFHAVLWWGRGRGWGMRRGV